MKELIFYLLGLASSILIITVLKLIGIKVLGKASEEFIESLFIKQKTQISESIKNEFDKSLENLKKDLQIEIAKEVEPLKASLGKENIAFQISYNEYIKRQYGHLEDLFAITYELKVFLFVNIKSTIFEYSALKSLKKQLYDLLESYIQKVYLCSLYLDEESRTNLLSYGQSVNELILKYTKYQDTLRRYEYLEERGFYDEFIDEEGEYDFIDYTEEAIETMKQENELLRADCAQKKKQVENEFIIVDKTIKKFLYKPIELANTKLLLESK